MDAMLRANRMEDDPHETHTRLSVPRWTSSTRQPWKIPEKGEGEEVEWGEKKMNKDV